MATGWVGWVVGSGGLPFPRHQQFDKENKGFGEWHLFSSILSTRDDTVSGFLLPLIRDKGGTLVSHQIAVCGESANLANSGSGGSF